MHFHFLHKFHSKELQWRAFLKNPLKSTTFIQKTYDLDKIYSSFFAQISSKRGIKRTPRKAPICLDEICTSFSAQISFKRGIKKTHTKHVFPWMKYGLHFLHKFHPK
jgi:hypothetical protein